MKGLTDISATITAFSSNKKKSHFEGIYEIAIHFIYKNDYFGKLLRD